MTRATDEAEVRALIDAWAEAIRAGNLSGALARHADEVVMFNVAEPLQHKGLAACREAWVPFLDGGPHAYFELGELSLHVGAEIAFAHALIRLEKRAEFAVRLTLGLEKRGGRWTIVHEHHSGPFVGPDA